MKDDCVFCKIVKGKIPSYKIYEDSDFFVFLDAFPSLEGQTLVVPKGHDVEYLFDMKDDDYCKLMKVVKKISIAVDKALKPIKTGIVVEGLEVDHVHVKLYPLMERKPLDLNSKAEVSEKRMKEIAEKIASFV